MVLPEVEGPQAVALLLEGSEAVALLPEIKGPQAVPLLLEGSEAVALLQEVEGPEATSTFLLCCSHVLFVCPTFLAGLNKCSHAYLLSAVHNESLLSWDKEGMYNL